MLKGFAYVIAVLAFQEAILRVFFPLPELSNFDRGMYTVVDEAKVNGFVRNRAYFWESSVDTSHRFNHYYNRYGFRDKEWRVNRNSNQTRILFVGDSYVESVMSDSTLTQYFKAMNPNELEVMNAGMLGTGISRYLKLFTDMAPIFRPDVVVMVVYANDFMYDEVQLPTHYLSEEYYDEWKPRVVELFQQWQRGAPVPFRLSTVVGSHSFQKQEKEGFSWNTQLQEMNNHATADLVKAMQEGTFNHHRLNEFIREERYLRKRRNLLVPMDLPELLF